MLKVGDEIQEFEGVLSSGQKITSKELKGKWVILFFFPKAFTPGCTKEVCNIRDRFENLKKYGVEIIGVSKDKLETQKKFKEKYNLPYELIADEKGEIIKKFGAGKPNGSAQRKTFIIDPEGKISFIFEKVNPDKHAEEIEKILKEKIKI
ncbi:Putative peroxiredoxin bcp [bacterium HR19]|nr:Putative peroxiredoxin bcp [bacterium HR19]